MYIQCCHLMWILQVLEHQKTYSLKFWKKHFLLLLGIKRKELIIIAYAITDICMLKITGMICWLSISVSCPCAMQYPDIKYIEASKNVPNANSSRIERYEPSSRCPSYFIHNKNTPMTIATTATIQYKKSILYICYTHFEPIFSLPRRNHFSSTLRKSNKNILPIFENVHFCVKNY